MRTSDSDKERAGGVRRDHDGIGKLIDSTEIRNPKEDFGQSAARIETEATEGWKPQRCGVVEECSDATMTEIDPVLYKAKHRGSVSNVFMFKPSES